MADVFPISQSANLLYVCGLRELDVPGTPVFNDLYAKELLKVVSSSKGVLLL
jgi:hypothetical protein